MISTRHFFVRDLTKVRDHLAGLMFCNAGPFGRLQIGEAKRFPDVFGLRFSRMRSAKVLMSLRSSLLQ